MIGLIDVMEDKVETAILGVGLLEELSKIVSVPEFRKEHPGGHFAGLALSFWIM